MRVSTRRPPAPPPLPVPPSWERGGRGEPKPVESEHGAQRGGGAGGAAALSAKEHPWIQTRANKHRTKEQSQHETHTRTSMIRPDPERRNVRLSRAVSRQQGRGAEVTHIVQSPKIDLFPPPGRHATVYPLKPGQLAPSRAPRPQLSMPNRLPLFRPSVVLPRGAVVAVPARDWS